MTTRTIYVVMGDQGAWSDWRQWMVKAFVDKDNARAHAQLATTEQTRLQEQDAELIEQGVSWSEREAALVNKYDPDGDSYDSWEATYTVHDLVLDEEE